uniref:Putative glutamyl-trnagln amidotransferase subunit c mitochondrial n=1 Tax=Anopheles darlingi TaxID=43151 RepID=A0A2M4DRV0_ANODA
MVRVWLIFIVFRASGLVGSLRFDGVFPWAASGLGFAACFCSSPCATTGSFFAGLLGPDVRPVFCFHAVQLLLRLFFVAFASSDALETLEDSIGFASRILTIGTEGVEPLYTVLERERLSLREDVVNDGDLQTDVLRNAAVTEEEYFVAPPGNIPLELQENSRPIAH